jgi:hypothetical protein
MKTMSKYLSMLLFATMLLMSACSDDDPSFENEEELITTVRITFVEVDEAGGEVGDAFSFEWVDMDGPVGGGTPVIDPIILSANKTYRYDLEFFNELEDPVEDITEEIREEDDEHIICFTTAGGVNLTITRTDVDGDGLLLGLEGTFATGNASEGSVTVILKHQPGVKNGECGPGETDVEATFPLTIQ